MVLAALAALVVPNQSALLARDIRPAGEIAVRGLDRAVDLHLIEQLAGFAAKDRLCAQQEKRASEPLPANYETGVPIRRGHAVYQTYESCMYEAPTTSCDADAEDLGTVRTLLESDPRLSDIISFDQLMGRLQKNCPSNLVLAEPSMVSAWKNSELEECNPFQPVLITVAIMLRTVPPRDPTDFHLWSAACRGTAAYHFVRDHCSLLSRADRMDYEGMAPPKQGIEAYFCPQIRNDFNQ